MRSNLRFCIFLAATALATSAYAKHDGDTHGPPPTPPGHGGDHGNPGNGGGQSGGVKVTPPAGTCSADDAGAIDVQGPQGQSGASHVAHTDFGKMDITTGAAVTSSSSANMMYFWNGSAFDFVLNAHQLDAGSQWTLTYQPEPLPSSGVVCLANGTANGGGQLHLAASVELNSNLPPSLDPTADASSQPPDALLALVLSADVDCSGGTMTTFAPEKYLWSNPRVRYVDTDLLPAVQ